MISPIDRTEFDAEMARDAVIPMLVIEIVNVIEIENENGDGNENGIGTENENENEIELRVRTRIDRHVLRYREIHTHMFIMETTSRVSTILKNHSANCDDNFISLIVASPCPLRVVLLEKKTRAYPLRMAAWSCCSLLAMSPAMDMIRNTLVILLISFFVFIFCCLLLRGR